MKIIAIFILNIFINVDLFAQSKVDVYKIINTICDDLIRSNKIKPHISDLYLQNFLVPLKDNYKDYEKLHSLMDSSAFNRLLLYASIMSKIERIDPKFINHMDVIDSSTANFYLFQADKLVIKSINKHGKDIVIPQKRKLVIRVSYPVIWNMKYCIVHVCEYFGEASGTIYLLEYDKKWRVIKKIYDWAS